MKNYSQAKTERWLTAMPLLLAFLLPASAQTGRSLAVTEPNTQPPSSNPPLTLTLQDCLQRAKRNSPDYRAALTESALAKEDKIQGRAALLPSFSYTTSFLYTQGNGLPTARFIANNGVHEYIAQGDAHQDFSLANVANYRRNLAAETLARARAEIATRGLGVTVVQTYYGFVVAQRKYATAQRAEAEAQHFFDITQKLEHGGEVAHSDVIKAQIQLQGQQRQLQDAELEMNRSRLDLAVLVFPDFREDFSVVDDLQTPEPLPMFPEVAAAAADKNPELRAALAALGEANQEVTAAWNGFLPSLSVDYFYGIDANQFATEDRLGNHNLGYAAVATLQLPIWNWGANRSKFKQADLRREQARVELTATQRELLAKLHNLFDEAQTDRAELESLSRSAELSAQSLHLTTMRYQAGEVSVLEVVDAQNTLTAARNALDDGQSRYRVALANLQTLTGTL
jgi:outer membrane protein TolC